MKKTDIKKTKLKRVAIIAAIIFLSLCVLLAVLYAVTELLSRPPEISDSENSFYEANYEENIFEDNLYTSRIRDVYYLEYGSGEIITYQSISDIPASAAFFLEYFNTVINGDYESYKHFFTNDFLKKNKIPERFTMQKIYDIEVDLFDRQVTSVEGEDITVDTFIVRYKIMQNNGTFRSDIGSNTIKPLVFELYRSGDTVLINSIKFKVNVDLED